MTAQITLIADAFRASPDTAKAIAVRQNSSNPSHGCIGSRLRIKRIACGISQQEFSELLGIDRAHLNAYEAGAERVNANLLLRIARLLHVRPDYFFQDYTERELEACLSSFGERVVEGSMNAG